MAIKQDEIIKTISKGFHTPTESPATIARCAISIVKETGRDHVYDSNNDYNQPFLTDEQINDVNTQSGEAAVVKFFTPLFAALFKDKIIINSETIAWLETGGKPMKPDLFAVPRWAYFAVFDKFSHGDDRPCGKVMDSRLYDTLYILDCKCTCTNEAFGELIIHMQHQNSAKNPKISRGMLFGKSEFWLATVQGTELIERTVGKWNQNGSGNHIKSFFSTTRMGRCGESLS